MDFEQRNFRFGLDKFHAFLKYCKFSTQLEVQSKIGQLLATHKNKQEYAKDVSYIMELLDLIIVENLAC